MVIINNFSNKTIIGKFVQVISKQKHPSLLGYFRVRCKNCTFKWPFSSTYLSVKNNKSAITKKFKEMWYVLSDSFNILLKQIISIALLKSYSLFKTAIAFVLLTLTVTSRYVITFLFVSKQTLILSRTIQLTPDCGKPTAIDHFTVSCLVAWPLNESEAGGDLVLIETSLLFSC